MSTKTPEFERECAALRVKVFSSVAHDVKTPLASIIGALQMLDQMREKLSPEQCDALIKTALTEAHRLDNFISEMLDKAKP